MPLVAGHALDGSPLALPEAAAGRVALVLIGSRASSAGTLDMYRSPFSERFGTLKDRFAIYQLSVVERRVFRVVAGLWQAQMKAALPEDRHATAMSYARSDAGDILKAVGVTNMIIGYALLLDGFGRVRWRAARMPGPETIDAMLRAARALDAER